GLDGWLFAAGLLSAVLHAGWNAAIKASSQPREAMAAQMMVAALLGLPGLVWLGLPPGPAWPWLLACTLLNTVAVRAVLRAYESGGFGSVYPISRAVSVLGVTAVAPLLLGDRIGGWTLAGVGLVTLALGLLAWLALRDLHATLSLRALAWTLLAGALTAVCVMFDARGVRQSGSAASYGFAICLSNALAFAWIQRRHGAPWVLLRRYGRVAWPAGTVSMTSYLLILWVYQNAPVAPASALRDTSAFFAIVISALWLKEPLRLRHLLVLGLALAGVPLLRLG
ncbi:MAG: EamA family transporter, partial [Rhodoferax sp.]|nr:EamA family transporter [Rhodoferax sp.]